MGFHGVDISKCQSEKSIAITTAESRREFLGTFNSLRLDGDTTDGDSIL